MWVVVCGRAQLAFLCLLVKTVRSLALIIENRFREAECSNRQITKRARPALGVQSLYRTVLNVSLGLKILAARGWQREVAIKHPTNIF